MTDTPGASLRILLVEDDEATRKLMRIFLENEGHAVREAADAKSALNEASLVAPDVLVCDCNLGGRHDGIETARSIQASCGCRVLLVSGYSETRMRQHSGTLEVSAFLQKPIEMSDLVAKVSGSG